MIFPTLSFEEYRHVAVHFAMRAERLLARKIPVVDHLLVKWYVTKVLKLGVPEEKQRQAQHFRFYGALQTLIKDGVFSVLAEEKRGKDPVSWLRVLKLNTQCWPVVFSILEPR